MTFAFFHDAAEKVLADLADSERGAVEAVRDALTANPRCGRPRISHTPTVEEYVYELDAAATGGRDIAVVYRYDLELDACLITWVIAGP